MSIFMKKDEWVGLGEGGAWRIYTSTSAAKILLLSYNPPSGKATSTDNLSHPTSFNTLLNTFASAFEHKSIASSFG